MTTRPPRWRSARRRSNEKSARAIHREWVAAGSARNTDPATDVAQLLARRAPYTPPYWLVKDAGVKYSPAIGGHPTKFWCRVLTDPFRLGGTGAWVTLISGVRGWVACEALAGEPAAPTPVAIPRPPGVRSRGEGPDQPIKESK